MSPSNASNIAGDTPDLIRTMAVDRFVQIINDHWQQPTEHFFDVGELLVTAKNYYGARSKTWQDMKSQFPFNSSVANKLISVATLPQRLFDQPEALNTLPDVLGTLYEISRLEDNDLLKGISSGEIHPGSTLAEISVFRKTCQDENQIARTSNVKILSEKEILERTVPLISIRVEKTGLDTSAIKQAIENINKLVETVPGVFALPQEQPPQGKSDAECMSLLEGMFQANHGHAKRDTFKQEQKKKAKPASNSEPVADEESDWTLSI